VNGGEVVRAKVKQKVAQFWICSGVRNMS